MKKLIVLIAFLATAELLSQTILPEKIDYDMTLSVNNSPFLAESTITVLSDASLNVEPGVTILMKDSANFIINGDMKIEGTRAMPVTIKNFDGDNNWGEIRLIGERDYKFRNLDIFDGRIYSYNSNLDFERISITNSRVEEGEKPMLWLDDGMGIIKKCKFENDSLGSVKSASEGVSMHGATPYVHNCEFRFVPDAMDFSWADTGQVSGNLVYYSTDDGIDLNQCENFLVFNNRIIHCTDKGLSLGKNEFNEGQQHYIYNNLIMDCNFGIAAKGVTTAIVRNNTFYANTLNVAVYDQGTVDISNSIFSSAANGDLYRADGAELKVNYSCSDREIIDGESNIKEIPGFVDSERLNFYLTEDSPCINSGDPSTALDRDGTQADIGAYPYSYDIMLPVINEINYHSPDGQDSGEWLEIFNNSEQTIEFGYWKLKIDSESYLLPWNNQIEPGEYLVLCSDKNKLIGNFHDVKNFIEIDNLNLNDVGASVFLYDEYGRATDTVIYSAITPWPELADGQGHSASLLAPDLDNNVGASWAASKYLGTPGEKNDFITGMEEYIKPIRNDLTIFPQPAFDFVSLEIPGISEYNSIEILDLYGKKVYFENLIGNNNKSLKLNIAELTSGFYILILDSPEQRISKGFIKN